MKTDATPRRRWKPYPFYALVLLVLWLLLWESASPGALLLGILFAAAGAVALAALRLPPASFFRLAPLPSLIWEVAVEVVRSNNAVARIILARRGTTPEGSTHRSGFVEVPLDMRSPYGLAALACILTATPGTVWVDHDPKSGRMLMHVLDMVDEETWVRTIKEKWERRLMEVFE